MTKIYPIMVLWTVLALISCSKEPPSPVVPPESAFVYTVDGQTYSTTAGIGFREAVLRGLQFHNAPIPVTVNGVRYQDYVMAFFSDTGSGQYTLRSLTLYRTDERGQAQRFEFLTDVAGTATQTGAETWSGTFAGKSTNAQNQVVSTLSNGTFDHIQLR